MMINTLRKHAFASEQKEAARPLALSVSPASGIISDAIDPGVFAVDDFLSEEQEIEILRQFEMSSVLE